MTKEQRVNPDPLYPKNRGYQFKGYYLDDASVPTFVYQSGDIEIEDRSRPGEGKNAGRVLIRELRFASPKEQTIWFRALTGKIETEAKMQFKTPDLQLDDPAAFHGAASAGRCRSYRSFCSDSKSPKAPPGSLLRMNFFNNIWRPVLSMLAVWRSARLSSACRPQPRRKSASVGARKSANENTTRSSTFRSRKTL